MERDSLLAHGTSFLCKIDSLSAQTSMRRTYANGADQFLLHTTQNHLMTPLLLAIKSVKVSQKWHAVHVSAKETLQVAKVNLPYVFRYLANELFAMNIRMQLQLEKSLKFRLGVDTMKVIFVIIL